jgi:virginiamycin B lyase
LIVGSALSLMVTGLGPAAAMPTGDGESGTGPITAYEVPTPAAEPYGIIAGIDGNIWFTESEANKIGRITPEGEFQEFRLPPQSADPRDMTLDAEGAIWFTELAGNVIGRITSSGHQTYYPVPTGFADPLGIAAAPDGTIWFTESGEVSQIGILTPPLGYIEEIQLGGDLRPSFIALGPDGAMWFTAELGNSIGRISVIDRSVIMYPIPTVQSLPWDITAGPDGAMWFTELAGHNIGRITMDGQITEFPIPTGFGSVTGITAGFDGNLWFVQTDDTSIGAITPEGEFVRQFQTGTQPNEIVSGPDGNLWFTERAEDSNAIVRLSVAPRGAGSVISADAGFIPFGVGVRQGNQVRWLFQGTNEHSVVDGLGLFDSGPQPVGTIFEATYPYAGRFRYGDPATNLRGRVGVSLEAPGTAEVGAPFEVRWAQAAPPAGFVFDVQFRPPGGGWTSWQHGVTDERADYTAQSAGSYGFRALLRDTIGKRRSGWSPIASVEAEVAMATSPSPLLDPRAFWASRGYLVPDPAAYERIKAAAGGARGGSSTSAGAGDLQGGPVIGVSIPGQHDLDTTPPDPTGSMGPNSYIQMINIRIAIYGRSGSLIAEAPIEQLVGGNHWHYTDPQVLWDPHTQRFYYLIWDWTSATFRWGFSKTDDPRTLDDASFCNYISGFGYSPFDAPDYPKLGQTKDFLLIGVNYFHNFVEWRGGNLLWIQKPRGSGEVTDCPENVFPTGKFRLVTQDGFLVDAPIPAQQIDPSHTGHVVGIPFTFTGDADNIAVFTVRRNKTTGRPILAPPRLLPVEPYGIPPYAEQCDEGKTLLDTLDGRLTRAVSAVDPSTGKVAVWTAHSVPGGGGSEVRWYEITPQRGDPILTDFGVASDPSLYVWNGAISSDRTVGPDGKAHGDSMVLGFSTASASDCPAVQMVSKVGSGPQSGFVMVKQSPGPLLDFSCVPICRWGDYGGAAPDPAAPLSDANGSIWLTNEIPLDPGGGQGTWIWEAAP